MFVLEDKYVLIRVFDGLLILVFESSALSSWDLVSRSALQDVKMCSIDPIASSRQIIHLELDPGEKWTVNVSQRYRPDKNLACTIAFVNSKELFPQVDQIGWTLLRDMNSGLKYLRESSIEDEVRSFFCQYSRTFCLNNFLVTLFGIGLFKRVKGCGSP